MIKVLIVEDDPMVADLNRKFIERVSEFTIEGIANNGEEALRILKENKIDLVILDIYIPKFNGMELLSEMRKLNIKSEVILVTAAKDVDKIDAAFKLGVVDYLIKPFEYSRLKKSLELYLKRYSLLKSTKTIEQNDIDYITVSKLGHSDEELPKGIHKMTLNRIIRYLEQNKVESFYSEEISEKLRMSKVTVRRYLDYLKDIGRVKLEIEYGMRGRPSYKYVFIN